MVERSLLVDLDDPRTIDIAEAIGNKTCKRILSLLIEKEMSESDIAQALNTPLNTVDYNVKKLLKTGLIEKSKNFFWSAKGKKIEMYRVANKKIVISPKTSFKGITISLVFSVLIAFCIKVFSELLTRRELEKSVSYAAEKSTSLPAQLTDLVNPTVSSATQTISDTGGVIASFAWIWFLGGAAIALFILWIWQRFIVKRISAV